MLNSSFPQRSSTYSAIKEHVNKFSNFRIHFTLLDLKGSAELFDEFDENKSCCQFRKDIKEFVKGLDSESSRIDFFKRLRHKTLMKAAEKLKCNKIFMADTSEDVAGNLLSNIALGRGNHLMQDISFIDNYSHKNIVIVRPLTNCTNKEVIFYNIYNNLGFLQNSKKDKNVDNLSSIQKMAEIFIKDLQFSYPSTVATVVSTASKLDKNESISGPKYCTLCETELEKESKELSASEAVQLSTIISSLGSNYLNIHNYNNDKNHCAELCDEPNNVLDDLPTFFKADSSQLCYGCRLIMSDSKSHSVWSDLTKKPEMFRKMQSAVQSYLL